MPNNFSKKNTGALVTAIVFVVIVIATVVVLVFLKPETSAKDEFSWITSDPAAVDGMLDGTYYKGEKNGFDILSYKIAETVTVGKDGNGNLKAENSGKNSCLMKIKIMINDEAVYSSEYLKPNQHIDSDKFDIVPEAGEYEAKAIFEGFNPTTEESIGVTEKVITVKVLE